MHDLKIHFNELDSTKRLQKADQREEEDRLNIPDNRWMPASKSRILMQIKRLWGEMYHSRSFGLENLGNFTKY